MAGDRGALEEALLATTPRLRAALEVPALWARSFDVDDVLQVTFLEAFLRIATLERRTPEAFAAWLRRIADNNLRDAIRALERDKRPDARKRVTRGGAGESSETLLARLAGDDATAGGGAALREELARMHAAIEKLPASYREVIRGLDLDQRPVPEVAAELGRSPGALHMLRLRAHDRLRELLGVTAT